MYRIYIYIYIGIHAGACVSRSSAQRAIHTISMLSVYPWTLRTVHPNIHTYRQHTTLEARTLLSPWLCSLPRSQLNNQSAWQITC